MDLFDRLVVGLGVVILGAAARAEYLEAQETRRRKGSPLRFDNGVSQQEFMEMARAVGERTRRVFDVQVTGMTATLRVRSNTALSTSQAEVDFNDYGHLTGAYWLLKGNSDSLVPEAFANEMQSRLKARLRVGATNANSRASGSTGAAQPQPTSSSRTTHAGGNSEATANANVHVHVHMPTAQAHAQARDGRSGSSSSAARWWRSPRFWFFALPLLTGGLASWAPPVWVASNVEQGPLRTRLYLVAALAAAFALIGAVLVGSAPEDALGNAVGPRADVGSVALIVAVCIGTCTALLHRRRVFANGRSTDEAPVGQPSPLPGVQEAQARRTRRGEYRRLAAEDGVLAREINIGRPDRTPAFDDGGLVDLNALEAAAIERYAHVTAAEAASIVATRDKIGRLSSVDELVVHGDLPLVTAERLCEYAVFLG